jgi:hypothetical protein
MELIGQLHAPATVTLVPTEEEGGWSSEPVWTIWGREKSLGPAGIPTLDHPASSTVTILNILPWLPI